ncbi:MAG TPA: alpha/beta hydrolase-fold protein [Usitatibacteraceae bacterium]|nr:alpha/beta hydrolase-fold protein [Usitatibacteraceae bacterium]
MKRWLAGLIVSAWSSGAAAQTPQTVIDPLPEVSAGRIERLEKFPSRHVAPRHVDVWLPADYSPAKRYQVLYMHDGQNLFDGKLNWTMKSWRADLAVSNLMKRGQIEDTIIVGIWNNGKDRYAEYYPQKFLAFAPDAVRREYETEVANGTLRADAYLKFVVEELKPAVDRKYSTRPGREHTFIAGSSMGGLISIYALCEYPDVFGGTAGLSTHWVGKPTAWGRERVRNAALPLAAMMYMSKTLPDPATHRIYSDRGDDWLDSLYAPAHRLFAEVLRDRGYTPSNAVTAVIDGTAHNEADWADRLERVLGFLLARR